MDEFTIKGKVVGDITAITLEHDSGAWHVDYIELINLGSNKVRHSKAAPASSLWIAMPGSPDDSTAASQERASERSWEGSGWGRQCDARRLSRWARQGLTVVGALQALFFKCQKWLDQQSGMSREMRASAKNPALSLFKYQVAVQTGNVRGAETDANVFITIIGSAGSTGRKELKPQKDSFSRNKRDVFILHHDDIGQIEKIALGHDNSGAHPAWFCESVEVVNIRNGDSAFFK